MTYHESLGSAASYLTDTTSFYDPANFYTSLTYSLIIFAALLALAVVYWRTPKDFVLKAFTASFVFAIIDGVLHFIIPNYGVHMPIYFINKVLFTTILIITAYRLLSNIHFRTLFVVGLLELRYLTLYTGREVFGLPFSVFNIIVHYVILYYLLRRNIGDR